MRWWQRIQPCEDSIVNDDLSDVSIAIISSLICLSFNLINSHSCLRDSAFSHKLDSTCAYLTTSSLANLQNHSLALHASILPHNSPRIQKQSKCFFLLSIELPASARFAHTNSVVSLKNEACSICLVLMYNPTKHKITTCFLTDLHEFKCV